MEYCYNIYITSIVDTSEVFINATIKKLTYHLDGWMDVKIKKETDANSMKKLIYTSLFFFYKLLFIFSVLLLAYLI